MIPGVLCATCAYFSQGWKVGTIGQCRKAAPIIDTTGDRPRTIWPLVRDDNWCGDHATVDHGDDR